MHCIGFFVGVLFVTPAFPCIFNKDIVSGQFPACPQKMHTLKPFKAYLRLFLHHNSRLLKIEFAH
jgi:hypothetical protein